MLPAPKPSTCESAFRGILDTVVLLAAIANSVSQLLLSVFPVCTMGAGGAYEVSAVTHHMAQLAGRDLKRNNPVRNEDRRRVLS